MYEGAPLLITAFFSIVPKLGFFFVLLLVFFFTFSSLAGVYGDLFFFSGLASIGLGMLYAFYQFKLKRLLAYSAITHVGYMLFALSQGSPEGFQAFLLYILIYIMSSLNIFGLLLAFRQQNTFYQLRKLVDLSFLQRSHGVLGLILSLTLLSFAGLPPLAGFFSKFYLFVSLMPFHNWAGLGGVMALTVPGSIYYLRMIRFSLFNPLKWVTFLFSIEVYRAHAFIIMISFYFNLFFFLFQGPLIL